MRALMRASRRFLRSFLARLSADSFTACSQRHEDRTCDHLLLLHACWAD
jgi:hypothetical protein